MDRKHENNLETIKAHPRGVHHLAAALLRHLRGTGEYLADKTRPEKGQNYARGEAYALTTVLQDAHRSSIADVIPAAKPSGKLAGMLDTILAEITAAQETINRPDYSAPDGVRTYLQSKLTNVGKLAALVRGVLLEDQRKAADRMETLEGIPAAGPVLAVLPDALAKMHRAAKLCHDGANGLEGLGHGPVVDAFKSMREAQNLLDSAHGAIHKAAGYTLEEPTLDGDPAAYYIATAPTLKQLPAANVVIVEGSLSFHMLRTANAIRQKEWCSNGKVPDLAYCGLELAGEVGEALNALKKIERERLGWAGSRTTLDALRAELADVVISADLVALCLNLDLTDAVVDKFNATSHERGLSTILQRRAPRPAPTLPADLDRVARASANVPDSLRAIAKCAERTAFGSGIPDNTLSDLQDCANVVELLLSTLSSAGVPTPALALSVPMGSGSARVVLERQRQIKVEGWTEEHDRQHSPLKILKAGIAYLLRARGQLIPLPEPWATPPSMWPWAREWWKPSDDPGRNLEKGGALVVAALDRLSHIMDTPRPARPPMILDRSDAEIRMGRPICGHTATPGAQTDFVPATVNGWPAVVDLVRAMAVLIHPGEVLEHGKQAKGALPAKLQRDGSRLWAWFILHESHSVVIL